MNCQFIPPSQDNVIGGINFPIQRNYPDLYTEEHEGTTNNDEVDLKYCERLLESNRFKGLVPMISKMDLERYYRNEDQNCKVCFQNIKTNRSEL